MTNSSTRQSAHDKPAIALPTDATDTVPATAHPDANLLDLYSRWQTAESFYADVCKSYDVPMDDDGEAAAVRARDDAHKVVQEVIDAISTHRAHTFAGVAVKLRVIGDYNSIYSCEPQSPESTLLMSLLHDMEAANV